MRILVLGAGLQGSACAYDLLQQRAVDRVTVADLNPQAAVDLLKDHLGSRLVLATVDVQDATALRDVLRGHDVVLCALPYYFNLAISRLALELGIHSADLGGNTDIVFQQKQLDAEARAKGVTVVPDCGLAPGIANILAAEGIRRVADAETVKLFVGGLPQRPEPPLNYQLVYSLEGALDYYTSPAWVLRDGKPTHVDPLSEPEQVAFPPPLGTLEAFHTAGGISTLPWTYQGRIRTMEYKTLRYPGHVALMRAIRDLGLLVAGADQGQRPGGDPARCVHRRGRPEADQAGAARLGGAAGGSAGTERRPGRVADTRLLRRSPGHQRDAARDGVFARDHRHDAGGRPYRCAGRAHTRRGGAVRGIRGGAGETKHRNQGSVKERCQVSGARCQVPDTRHLTPGTF